MRRFARACGAALRGLAIFLVLSSAPAAGGDDGVLLLATTTSVRDTGLLDELLPDFTRRTGLPVKTIAVGSGAALRMGRDGNADVLLTHAPDAEQVLVEAGALVSREPFMENFFVVIGPDDDPADVRAADDVRDAYRRIAASGARYVSRGDDSGTHMREREILAAAGLPEKGGWEAFQATGAGMGLTLQVAGERRAYTLSDLGTYLAYAERIDLAVLSKPEERLRNVYSVLRVNPERAPGVNAEGAAAFEAFLLDPEVQRRIGEFGRARFGRPLFVPLRAARAGDAAEG